MTNMIGNLKRFFERRPRPPELVAAPGESVSGNRQLDLIPTAIENDSYDRWYKGRDGGPRSGPENSGHALRGISEGLFGGETRSVSAVRHKTAKRVSTFLAVGMIGTFLGRALMNVCALAVLLMMFAIVAQVVASRIGVTTVIDLGRDLPLFGTAITLNSLTDLQWYLLAMIALLPAGLVWLRDGHVRVDFIYSRLGKRQQALIDILCLLIFTLPFLLMIIPDSWEIMQQAFARGEKSTNGGLTDRYLARAVLPVGLSLLLFASLREAWRILRPAAKK